MEFSQNVAEIASAMCKMQSELTVALKLSQGYGYKYADLATVWETLKVPLTSNGLMVIQDAFTNENGASVQTMIIHTSGQWIKSGVLTVTGCKNDAHGAGSAITYGKRYQLSALVGIVADQDDDGKTAMANTQKEQVKSKPKEVKTYATVNIDKWYAEKDKLFTSADIRDYVFEASEKMLKNEQETINYLNSLGTEKFKESFTRWMKNKTSE